MFFSKRLRSVVYYCVLFSGIIFSASAGQDIRFSDAWKFHRGDVTGAEATSYNDASWPAAYLPHPDSILLNYNTGSYYVGICWYRKTFTPPSSYQGKKLFLEFEAAMQTAQVYVNGTLITTHLGGYTPFVLDITNNIQIGVSNVIAARLDNTASANFPPGNTNPDFLYFGGLYRNAALQVTDSLHITNAMYANITGGGGIFVTYPSVSTSSATVQVNTHVLNEYTTGRTCVLATTILTTGGLQVATTSNTQSIAAGAAYTFSQSLTASNPQLWHPDHPSLYVVRSQVYDNARLADTCSTAIGIRTIAFSKANGFQINGARFYFRGADRHQCYPYIGNAVPNSGQYRDALRMKQYGFNFVRMSHYVQAQSYVDACDKLGILAMGCLPGWQYFNNTATFINNSTGALREMIRYYRNHPSVILWEAMHNESGPTTAYLTSAQSIAHVEYPGNQMFTCGEEGNNILDVYLSSSQHNVRAYAGARPCSISEYGDWDIGPCVWGNPITGCADRVSRSDGEASLLTQARNHASGLSLNRALSWLTGDALWSAYDYQTWVNDPLTTSGVLDIFRIPKFSAYFFKSQRAPGDTLEPGTAKGGPMVFIASYWTATSARPVTVFSNCEQVSLYLNGTLVATQSPATGTNLEHPTFSFTIASFQSGTLRADGLIGGVVRATHSVTTPGTAARVSIVIDTADVPFTADGSDIAIVYASILDANGTTIPTATNSVTFTIASGPGDLIGINPQTAEAGIASILLRSRTTAGRIVVNAGSGGMTGSDTVTSVVTPVTGIINPFRTAVQPEIKTFVIRQTGRVLLIQVPNGAIGKRSAAVFTLYNAQGRQIKGWNLKKGTTVVNMQSLPHGLYLGQISNGIDRYAQKVVW